MTIKKDIIAIIVGLIISIVLFGSIYTVKISAPDNAVVYVDQETEIYYAPPYIDNAPDGQTGINTNNLKAFTLNEVRELNYTPDKNSVERGYFKQQYRSLTSYLLEKIGLRKPLPTRWTPNGEWNW